ncbi:MAG: hypothetical protein O2972_10910 [Cyanobacteria bacterium]|nr:hypothetical protein [Cyanobacteriota bacterium]
MTRFIKEKLKHRIGRKNVPGWLSVAPAILPAPLLHGEGGSRYDELVIFGGLGIIIGVLILLSFRTGRNRKNKKRARQRRRHR